MIKAKNLCIFCKMEKKRVLCSDQTFTYEKFNAKRNQSRVGFIAHLHQRLRLYTIGWINLNLVVYPMHLVRNIQLRLLHQKSSINPRYYFDWSMSESARACWDHMAQWFQFCTNNWVWKKLSARWMPRLLTVVNPYARFQNNVWRCFS